MMRHLTLLTCTYPYEGRAKMIRRCCEIFGRIDGPTHWVLIEDAAESNLGVQYILKKQFTKHPVTYLAYGPTKAWGNAQKDFALHWIRDNVAEGVVYIADDDNGWADELFPALRELSPGRVGVLPAGNMTGTNGIERPLCYEGKIYAWDNGFSSRLFPVDMAGFCFDVRLLDGLSSPIWEATRRGGESIFLKRILASKNDFQPLCDDCNWCGVWHDAPFTTINERFNPIHLPRFRITY